MITKEEAKTAVLEIATRYGYINDLTGSLDPATRARLEERFLSLETIAATSVKTLAKQLYGSDARCIYELLQNAEDNQFKEAEKRDQAPFVSFHVHPDEIIIECNEDGFSKEDLSAICTVGKSKKTAHHGYIGAKGIGFKSVFIAAWKVRIQSGAFSFDFEHKKGDPGLGMVRPIWVEPDEELDGPLTRMTLSLHDDGEEADIRHLRGVIFEQLRELKPTCLLFLRKIKCISIVFYDEDGEVDKSSRFHKDDVGNNRINLATTTTNSSGSETVKLDHYHVTKHMATGLARSDNRDLKIAAEIASAAEVVLAFQLTSESKPVDEKQQVFAFLPMRESEFRFLIQSDFDTGASREYVLKTSRRNLDLLDAIANTFIKAVLQFSEHRDLCYTWPEFLPLAADCSSGLWSILYEKIKSKVAGSYLLRSRTKKNLRKISEVFISADGTTDSKGALYLDDPDADPFLAPQYESGVRNKLKEYGLNIIQWNHLLRLLRRDLEAAESRMRNHSTPHEWHSGVAKLFSQCFKERSTSMATNLRSMKLLPLRDGTWTAAADGPVYLPTIRDIDIPPAIDLKTLDAQATANRDRHAFFEHLGAVCASINGVRSAISRAYDESVITSLTLDQSRTHLHFLYLTHNADGVSAKLSDLGDLRLISKNNLSKETYWTTPSLSYLPGDSLYGPKALLAQNHGAPGMDVDFVRPLYLEEIPTQPSPSHMSWEAWLRGFLGVQQRLKLTSVDGSSLSETSKYVTQHRPEKFMGLLQYLWKYEGKVVIKSSALLETIRNLPADRFCGSGFPSTPNLTLRETSVPSPKLWERAVQYMEEPELFPFLLLDDEQDTRQLSPKWSFLSEHLKIHHADGVSFLARLLVQIRGLYHAPSSVPTIQKICDLYVAIEAGIKTDTDQLGWRTHFQTLSREKSTILVPSQADGSGTWSTPSDCFWNGPADMVSKNSLKSLYSRMLGHDEMVMLDEFFSRTLNVLDASMPDILTELRKRKETSCVEAKSLKELYKYLDWMSQARDAQDKLRQIFDEEALIYASESKSPGWYRTSEYLWSSTTEIRGKAVLEGEFEDLRELFVEKLGVRSLTIQMVYDELVSGTSSSNDGDIKLAVFAFNALLQTEMEPLDAKKMRQACIFPIRYPDGNIRLGSSMVDFAIGDRDYLLPSFRDKIKTLTYTMEDVRQLRPFFEWTRLQDRYLSNLVKEDTSVAEGAQSPISSKIRDLRFKAHHIVRIAATFNSPRYIQDAEGLYRQLLTAKVIETDRILAVLKVSQDGELFKVEEKAGDDHVDDADSALKIYVPRDRKAQNVSFSATLPKKLADWLMRNTTTQIRDTIVQDAIIALTMVMTTEKSALDRIFALQGIHQIPMRNEDEEPSGAEGIEDNNGEDGVESPPIGLSVQGPSTAEIPQGSNASATRDEDSTIETLANRTEDRPQIVSDVRTLAEGTRYQYLLNKVVAAARGPTDHIPDRGVFDMSSMLDVLYSDELPVSYDGTEFLSPFRSSNQLERDKKVGAAGELFAFEVFRGLDFPSWGRENWQSRIRHLVTVHPDYNDLQPWHHHETADIVYKDVESRFTGMLIEKGYMGERWLGATPKYFLEVKTTTGPCNTPFYMSSNQCKLMQRIHENRDVSEIYVIVRVSRINSERPRVCVYLDPEELKRDGQLVFTARTWSVIPGSSTLSQRVLD